MSKPLCGKKGQCIPLSARVDTSGLADGAEARPVFPLQTVGDTFQHFLGSLWLGCPESLQVFSGSPLPDTDVAKGTCLKHL